MLAHLLNLYLCLLAFFFLLDGFVACAVYYVARLFIVVIALKIAVCCKMTVKFTTKYGSLYL